jgi:hypothetical protein
MSKKKKKYAVFLDPAFGLNVRCMAGSSGAAAATTLRERGGGDAV